MSFNTESLGFGRGDKLPSNVSVPPPTFPPLNNKPVQLQDETFLLKKSEDLRSYFRSSKYFITSETDMKVAKQFDWDFLPDELKPRETKRDHKKRVKPNLTKRPVDIENKLKELESKESSSKGKDHVSSEEEGSDSDDDKKSVENGSDGEEQDEEMDEGGDYANNYFDNGEAYEDGEDDNLDDGGIY